VAEVVEAEVMHAGFMACFVELVAQEQAMAIFRKTAQSAEDLIVVWLYIAQDNPPAADHLLDTFEEKGQLLAENEHHIRTHLHGSAMGA